MVLRLRRMRPRHWLWLAAVSLFLLTSCAPQVMTVEVTRLVTDAAASAASATPAPPLEVTRLVTAEVTRIVTETVTVEVTVTPASPGSAERPLQLLLAPAFPPQILQDRAAPLAEAVGDAVGGEVAVGILDDEAAIQTVLCGAPRETMALLSPLAAARANVACGSQVLATGVQVDGLSWTAGMVVVRRDSGLAELADLDGRIWAVAEENSLANYQYMQALFVELDVTPAEIRFFPGDNTALLAVYNGEADFATATYLPPVLPFAEQEWVYGEDDPELWRRLGIPPARSGQGFVVVNGPPEFGGYRIRDARAGIFDTTPAIFAESEILMLTPPLPVQTLVVGAEFPLQMARRVETALVAFGASEQCAASLCAPDFLSWQGVIPAADVDYDPLRLIVRNLESAAEEE